MRKGHAVKAAVATVLRKSWAAARVSIKLHDLEVRFSGTGASVVKTPTYLGIRAVINLPDFADDVGYSDEVVDRMVAMALHELAHCFFTVDSEWDAVLTHNMVNGVRPPLLHKCINAFDDVRIERKLIDSGYAVGAERLLPILLAHMTRNITPEAFKQVENIPFAVCVDGRGYGVSVVDLVGKYEAVVREGIARCATQITTTDAALNGLWLWNLIKKADKSQQDQQQEDGGKGEVFEVEPEAFDGVPMSGSASIPELGHVIVGKEDYPADRSVNVPLPALGRLSFELRHVLENTSRDTMARHLTAGRLSRNWAAIARGADDVFERRTTEEGIDSAVLVAIDQSQSMALDKNDRNPSDKIGHAATAARMIGQVLSRCAGVSWDVRGFSAGDSFMGVDQQKTGKWNYNSGEIQQQAGWWVFKGFNEPSNVFTRRSGGLYATRSTTPDIAALADVLRITSQRPEKRKVVIWIGDGDGYSANAAIALQEKYPNVKVIGIGIGVDLSGIFKHSVKVDDAKDLASVSFRTIIKAIAA